MKSMRHRFAPMGGTLAILVFLALAPTGCEKGAGTYVHVKFEGSTSSLAPIARLDLEITLAEKTISTFFTSPKPITLPTDATLEIGTGEGPIDIEVKARAANGMLVGKGQGSDRVKRGSVVIVKVSLAPASEPDDGGSGSDTGGRDTQPRTGGMIADAANDRPGSGGNTGGTGGQSGNGGTSGGANLIANPQKLDLGTATIGNKTPPQSLTLTNQGTKETGLLAFSVQNPAQFLINSNPCAGISLQPGAACTLTIIFKPILPGQIESALKISAPGIGMLEIQLLGQGVGAGTASLNLSPPQMDFGKVDLNSTGAIGQFTVTNTGTITTGLVNVSFEANTPNYRINNDLCRTQSLAPGKTCTFSVTFTPKSVGPAHVNLLVRTDPGVGVTSPLSGTGRQLLNLILQITGNGKGNVKAPGLECSTNICKATLEWIQPSQTLQVALDAIPEAGSVFGGYGVGPCGAEPRCTVTLTSDMAMTARFDLQQPQLVQFGLNVLSLAGHRGSLVVTDGAQSSICDSSCGPETRSPSPSVTITAKPDDTSTFAGWTEGPCKGTNPTCTFALTSDTFIFATFGPQSYVFTSSTMMGPNTFGGLSGADNECQRLAQKANLLGTYRAWVSTSTEPARTRIGNGGWIRTDGRPFASSLAALVDSTNSVVYYPARLDETGQDLGPKSQWVATGSDSDGNPALSNCLNFTSAVGEINLGDSATGSRAWSFREPKGKCANRYRLLCFRTDLSAGEIKPPTLPGRRIFVTKTPFTPGGGLNSADLACQVEAKALNLGGGFIAFISTSTLSARNRISMGRPWKRLDEVFVAKTPEDFVNETLLAPLGVAANGVTHLTANVWTGSKNPAQNGIEETSCLSFKTGDLLQRSFVGISNSTVAPEWFAASLISCGNSNTHLICIEP